MHQGPEVNVKDIFQKFTAYSLTTDIEIKQELKEYFKNQQSEEDLVIIEQEEELKQLSSETESFEGAVPYNILYVKLNKLCLIGGI